MALSAFSSQELVASNLRRQGAVVDPVPTNTLTRKAIVRYAVVFVIGLMVIAVVSLATGMHALDTCEIVGLTAAASALATVGGAVMLFVFRRRSLASQAMVVALSSCVGIGVGAWTVGDAMFITAHDVAVLAGVIATAGIVSCGAAAIIGVHLDSSARQLIAAQDRLSAVEKSRRDLVEWISGDLTTVMADFDDRAAALSEPDAALLGKELVRIRNIVDTLIELNQNGDR